MGWRRVLRGTGIALLWALAMAFAFVLHNAYPNLLEQFGITTGVVIVAIALFAYITVVRSELSERVGESAYSDKKWIETMMAGDPIKPVRIKPDGMPQDGWGVSKEDHIFYEDFEPFGRMLNDWFEKSDDAWRLQERKTAELTKLAVDSPVYGRSYDIHYNQPRMGRLEISAAYKYSHESPEVHAILELHNPRLFSRDEIVSLHQGVAHHLTNDTPEAVDRSYRELQWGMIEAMWSAGPDAIQNPSLEVGLRGIASTYLYRLEHWNGKDR